MRNTVPSANANLPSESEAVYLRPRSVYFTLIIALFLALAGLAACADSENTDGATDDTNASDPAGENDDLLNVVVTMPFLPSMVDAVGGDHVEIESIVPQGVDAHTYQPTPSDAQMIADADIIFVNGLGLEEFLDGLIESAGGVDALVYELADGLQDAGIETDSHHHHHDHDDHDHDDHDHDDHDHDDHDHDDHDHDDHDHDDHDHDDHDHDDHDHDDHDHNHDDHHHDHDHDYEYGNPHFWLSPEHGIHYVENIYESLAEADPENEADYRSNADSYVAEIEAFDEWAQEEMAQIPDENRYMVTFHDAFPYFAEYYDLEVVGVVIASPGREPGAQELAQLTDEIQEVGVPAVFVEPQFNPAFGEAIADEAGVQTLLIYSDTPPEDAGYLEMMELNVESVVEGLR